MKKFIRATLCSAFLVPSAVFAAPALEATATTPAPQAAQTESPDNWAWD